MKTWNPTPHQHTASLRRLLHSKRFLFGGLALVSVPAAAGGYALYAHAAVSARSTVSVNSSSANHLDTPTDIPEPDIQSATAGGGASNSIKVTVNGQDIPIPPSGVLDYGIESDNSTTEVHVDASSDNDSSSNTSLNVNVNSHSSSDGNSNERSNTDLRIRSSSR